MVTVLYDSIVYSISSTPAIKSFRLADISENPSIIGPIEAIKVCNTKIASDCGTNATTGLMPNLCNSCTYSFGERKASR